LVTVMDSNLPLFQDQFYLKVISNRNLFSVITSMIKSKKTSH
jgi:hypothetical protein